MLFLFSNVISSSFHHVSGPSVQSSMTIGALSCLVHGMLPTAQAQKPQASSFVSSTFHDLNLSPNSRLDSRHMFLPYSLPFVTHHTILLLMAGSIHRGNHTPHLICKPSPPCPLSACDCLRTFLTLLFPCGPHARLRWRPHS